MPLSKEQGGAVWERRWEGWVEKAHAKHGHKYTYPSSAKDEANKLRIVCAEHGEFLQLPAKHIWGQGCAKCSGHGADHKATLVKAYPAWDWSAVDVPVTTKEMFAFSCTIHREQSSNVNRLLTKPGTSPCPTCSRLAIGARVSAETWAQRIEEKWGSKVTLDKASAGLCQEKARFTCSTHGIFTSILMDVAQGHGCPECGKLRQGHRSVRIPK